MTRLIYVALMLSALCGMTTGQPYQGQISLQSDGPIRTMDDWSYEDCGRSSDPVQIKSIEVYPNPPQPGKDLKVTVKASVSQRVEDGAFADVVVKLGLVKLLHKRFDLCEEARNADADVQCPIEKGDYEVTQTVALPKEIPRAKFSVDVKGYTTDEDDLLCLKLKVNFMKFLRFGM